ncbi:MAG TPA: hypothetical protein VHA75_10690, partial [Rugosimonospora sp.]|nr:hypothetical protein [Rugosimonospora sp.]
MTRTATPTATRTRHRRHADGPAQAGLHRLTKPIVTGIVLALAMTAASVVGLGATFAASEPPVTAQGLPVPASLRQPIAAAALSCPTLTPARLAGQLMATSHFDTDATFANRGRGVAGLSDAEWKKWAPAPQAARTDAASTVLALAHEMCDLVGAVRAAKVPGDLWHNALAAFFSGTPAVVKAKGIPSGAAAFVDQVDGYATWYA